MSLIDTDGTSARFLIRAQKWAITSESAPRSSKKWLPAATCSTCMMSASNSARISSADCAVMPVPRSQGDVVTGAQRGGEIGRRAARADDVLAVHRLPPAGLVDGVEIALAQVRGDGHRGEIAGVMQGEPAHGPAGDRAGGTAEQEPATSQPVAGTDG